MSRVNRASTLLCLLFPPTLSPTLSHIADDYTSHHQYCIGHALPSLFPPCLIPCRVPFGQKSMSFLLYDFIYRRAACQTPIDPSRRERHLHKHKMSLQNTPSFALLRPEHSLTNHSVVAQAQMASATGQTQIRLTTFPFFLQETHYTEKRKGCANYGIPCKKGHPPFQKLTRNTPCYGVGVVSKAQATNNTNYVCTAQRPRRMETVGKRHLGGFDQIGPSLRAGLFTRPNQPSRNPSWCMGSMADC